MIYIIYIYISLTLIVSPACVPVCAGGPGARTRQVPAELQCRELVLLQRGEREGAHGDTVQKAGIRSEGQEQELSACGVWSAGVGCEGREQGTGAIADGTRHARSTGPCTGYGGYGGQVSGARDGSKGWEQEVMTHGIRDPPVRAPGIEGGRQEQESGVRDGSEVAGREL
ncbi:hypothetical protein K488DRAFT_75357 [Vararia minispora EC-137]|uniref:Uncharacterized protein n=1 Tax=Vararia minispora EC-137 TaxID=1314806 RepID=A0ACB8Q437_9AGAM|nr:hypothetical protein K488DRAFT_75357 [Vararia minispora EC-137]